MISENRKQQLRDLASRLGAQIKLDRNAVRLRAAEQEIAVQLESLSGEEADFVLEEIGYVIDPSSRPRNDGRRIVLDHDVSAFLQVVAALRARTAPKNKK